MLRWIAEKIAGPSSEVSSFDKDASQEDPQAGVARVSSSSSSSSVEILEMPSPPSRRTRARTAVAGPAAQNGAGSVPAAGAAAKKRGRRALGEEAPVDQSALSLEGACAFTGVELAAVTLAKHRSPMSSFAQSRGVLVLC